VGLQGLGHHLALVDRQPRLRVHVELGVAAVLVTPEDGELEDVGVEAEAGLVVVDEEPDVAAAHGSLLPCGLVVGTILTSESDGSLSIRTRMSRGRMWPP